MMINRKTLTTLAPLAVIALVLIFFAKLAFTNLILARGDTYAYFYPYWHAAGEALRAGRFPLWNDMLFMGAPFMANSQVGLFYPPNWPLWAFVHDTPTAIKINILLHLAWAGLGTFALLRGPLRMGTLAALTGAALFAVGGHLTAHVEQINQLQGLSWLPWLFLLLDLTRTRPLRWVPVLAMALALQLLSGHTQTVFIGLVGMGVMALWWAWRGSNRQDAKKSRTKQLRPLLVLIFAGVVALLLTLPQLLPTLELSSQSNRAGGLSFNEVISFSLPPTLFGRVLLPGYDVALHNEYIGVMGLAGLALAMIGAWAARKTPRWQAWIAVTGLGLFLAFGGWNPIYLLLGRLPGFNLFRVPARWLALFVLGGSVLAAHAVQRLCDGDWHVPRNLVLSFGGIVLVLIVATFLSPLANDQLVQGTVEPSVVALCAWLLTCGVVIVLLLRAPGKWAAVTLAGIAMLELLIASGNMPYNRLNAPQAFSAQRPAISQLLARQENDSPSQGRFLSMSDIFFDPGDLSIIQAIYEPQLSPPALEDFIVTGKMRDVISPNLGMVWGLPSVDGFDGGVLPLRNYTNFSRLLLDDPPPDGRLRENLPAIPAQRWLDLMGVQYLITDKVGDDWYGGVFYDLQWETPLGRGGSVSVGYMPDFEATALGVVYSDMMYRPRPRGSVEVTFGAAESSIEIFSQEIAFNAPQEDRPYSHSVISWETPQHPTSITFSGLGLAIHGAALIDERTGAFHPLTVTPNGSWRLVHSGDVKIYENLNPLPRAFLVNKAEIMPDDADALARMGEFDFAPGETVILAEGDSLRGQDELGQATITQYEPERVVIEVATESDAHLVLTDAYYPGWLATLDEEPVPILRADVIFRTVFVPAGEHTLVMAYTPTSWPGALIVAALAWILVIGTVLVGMIHT